MDTTERSGSRRRKWLPVPATVTEIVASGRGMGRRGSLAIGMGYHEQLLPPRGWEGHCTKNSLEGTFEEQQGRMSQGDRRARDKEERMNEGKEPGLGRWDIGGGCKDTSGTEEGRGQTEREGMLSHQSPSHCPPSSPPRLKVKNRACGKAKTE